MKKLKKLSPRVHLSYKLYILMRNDIPSMNPGKAMAQAAHAANHFVANYGHMLAVKEDWMNKSTPFGTTIVLSVNQTELLKVMERAKELDVPADTIWDETYPCVVNHEIAQLLNLNMLTAPTIWKDNGNAVIFRNEFTCGYVFVPDGSSIQEELMGALPLHP